MTSRQNLLIIRGLTSTEHLDTLQNNTFAQWNGLGVRLSLPLSELGKYSDFIKHLAAVQDISKINHCFFLGNKVTNMILPTEKIHFLYNYHNKLISSSEWIFIERLTSAVSWFILRQ